jgi:putative tricarboxylic transport membrane protein
MRIAALKRLIPYIVPLGLAVFLYVRAGQFGAAGEVGQPGPDLWPRMICVVLGLTALVGLVGAMFRAEADGGEPDTGVPAAAPETNPELVWIGIATVGLYVFALPHLGFFVATTLLAMALLVTGGMRRWALVPVIGLALALVFSVIFLRIVYVGLPLGEGWFRAVSLTLYRLIGVH